jgi:hypothetical protein
MPEVDIIGADLFALSRLRPEDILAVMGLAYQVAEHAGQRVYLAVFGVDGRTVGGPPLEGPPEGAVVRLGREDARQADWFGRGRDIVLWQPPSEEWSAALVGHHWWHQRQLSWGVLVDERELMAVVASIQRTWPRRHKPADNSKRLESTIAPERALVMLSHDGSFFAGRASPACWELVRRLLGGVGGGDVEVYETDSDG